MNILRGLKISSGGGFPLKRHLESNFVDVSLVDTVDVESKAKENRNRLEQNHNDCFLQATSQISGSVTCFGEVQPLRHTQCKSPSCILVGGRAVGQVCC